jgi:transcriptional regulator with XRE-family HTH domain
MQNAEKSPQKLTKVSAARGTRFRHVEELTFKGLSQEEIARELGVNVRTIRRDLKMITEVMLETLPSEIAVYRSGVLRRLASLYEEARQDLELARKAGKATWPYLMVCSRILMNMAQSSGVITYTNKLADYQSRPPEQEADEKTTAGTSKIRIPEQRVGKLYPFLGLGQNRDAPIVRRVQAVGE